MLLKKSSRPKLEVRFLTAPKVGQKPDNRFPQLRARWACRRKGHSTFEKVDLKFSNCGIADVKS